MDAGRHISETDTLALDIITKIGLSLSITGLAITIITFVLFKLVVYNSIQINIIRSALSFFININWRDVQSIGWEN